MAYTDIDNPELYFQTKLYTGTGSALSVTLDGSENMKPDWIWIKERNASDSAHNLTDSVRGAGKGLFSNTTSAEYDYGTGTDGSVRTFNTDGFTLGTATQVNPSGVNMVSWNWKKVAGVFDIQTYAGNNTGSRQVSHNLGVVPSLIIIKNRTNAAGWFTGTTAIPFTWNTDYLQLNETGAKYTDGNGHTFGAIPTSSYFVPGDNNDTNGNSNNYVAYLFGNKQGVSKVGSYKGNGNADGTFVFLGFKPAFLMVKRTDSTNDWRMFDNKRDPDNGIINTLKANTTDVAEDSSALFDFTANGFKGRNTDYSMNASGGTYVYMAFAEQPFVSSSGVPANAR